MCRGAGVAALAALLIAFVAVAWAQHQHGAPDTGAKAAPPAPPSGKTPRRVSEAEMHHLPGGVPAGWRFSWPDGDAKKGREVFAKLECYQCHEVPGGGFPEVQPDPTRRGPALAGMGSKHPPEYFAESILNPNAIVVTGPGFTGPDGLSIMPDFRDSLTLAETIDLVAYIRSLTGGGHGHHDAGGPPLEQVTASYRVRLAYVAAGAPEHTHGSHHARHHGASPSQPPAQSRQPGAVRPAAHLMVFVSDLATGEPVPYLPMTATIRADKASPRTVKLTPMLGDLGFHYGVAVALPAGPATITVAIGKPTIAVMPSAGGHPSPAATSVTFEWRP
jgi:hypothetical protein